jgi:hypothetical protein
VRALILSLALANLLFLGWSNWIDRPAAVSPPAAGVTSLQLAPAPGAKAAMVPASLPARCASLGPFIDGDTAKAVGTALRSRGLEPRERIGKGEAADGYWVYIDDLRDPDARARALKRLAKGGIHDSAVLASSGQISVGLFSSQEGAEMRATAVRATGLEPIVKPRLRPVDERWFDVQLAGDAPMPAVDALMAGLAAAQPPSWGSCPGAESGAAAATAQEAAPPPPAVAAARP